MVAPLCLLASLLSAAPLTHAALLPDSASASASHDTAAVSMRVVRRFPPIEVQARPFELLSSQTVHAIGPAALRTLPVDDFAGALSLQAGVVAQGEELHVRGGRSGETVVVLDGVSLSEPLRNRALAVPLFALRSANLVSGAPEARFASGLAGTVDLQTIDPGRHPDVELRWQTDGRTETRYDRVSTRASAPLGRFGLGVVAATDVMLDDTNLPALRTESRQRIGGLSFGWRAENRLLGYLKLAPIDQPRRFNAQLLVSRQVHRPYDPSWTLDGWTLVTADAKSAPIFSTVPLPGSVRYRAADHLAITDDRGAAGVVSVSTLQASRRGTLSLGWLRTRTVTSLDGQEQSTIGSHRPFYNNAGTPDRFHVLWGDYPLYRESGSDEFTLRGDGELAMRSGSSLKAGAGLTYDELRMREVEWLAIGENVQGAGEPTILPLDSLRAFHVWAPGAFAYVQGRWLTGGLVMNAGLRGEYFTPGPQASRQTLPGRSSGVVSLSPRLGIAYPISVRDAFSLAYMRIQQAPARDYLYDEREVIADRQPLGNAALLPATLISYEASVKHLFNETWSLQTSVFYRDLFGQVGAREASVSHGETNLTYTNDDEGHASGFELSLVRAVGERRRIEAHYTWMQAWGSESRSEGDPYGPIRGPNSPLVVETPLSWDRHHSLSVSGAWSWRERLMLAWSTAVGSPLPWTPKPLREVFTDYAAVNSRRLSWTETTNADVEWSPPHLFGLVFGIEARNLFDHRNERAATLDGYPNPIINTLYDDYGAYRTETGSGGGAYYAVPAVGEAYWVPIRDPRLLDPPRAVRASLGLRW